MKDWRGALRQEVLKQAHPGVLGPAIRIEDVFFSGPSAIAVTFFHADHAGVLFGFRFPADTSDGRESPESWASIILANLVEEVEATDRGLPSVSGEDRPVWLRSVYGDV